jgi:hypothetical protein
MVGRVVGVDEETGHLLVEAEPLEEQTGEELIAEVAEALDRALERAPRRGGAVDIVVFQEPWRVLRGEANAPAALEAVDPEGSQGGFYLPWPLTAAELTHLPGSGKSHHALRLTQHSAAARLAEIVAAAELAASRVIEEAEAEAAVLAPDPVGLGRSARPGGEGRPLAEALATAELAERMLPDAPIPSPAQALLAQREARVRWETLQEFGAFTSEELADQRSQARNRHALANRWRREGRIFSVELRGRRLFPGFQFDPVTFAPEPLVARVLEALPREEMSEWETALWWVAADPHLAGRRPVDLMRSEPEAVLAAAAALAGSSPL